MTPFGWLIAFKIYIVWAGVFLIYLLNKKAVSFMFFGVVAWLREGFEDADGKFHSKDIFLMIFSGVLISMIFLEWGFQRPFSTPAWLTIDVLMGGGVVSKWSESSNFNILPNFFGKKNDKQGQ
jgi:hypothetical protein